MVHGVTIRDKSSQQQQHSPFKPMKAKKLKCLLFFFLLLALSIDFVSPYSKLLYPENFTFESFFAFATQ